MFGYLLDHAECIDMLGSERYRQGRELAEEAMRDHFGSWRTLATSGGMWRGNPSMADKLTGIGMRSIQVLHAFDQIHSERYPCQPTLAPLTMSWTLTVKDINLTSNMLMNENAITPPLPTSGPVALQDTAVSFSSYQTKGLSDFDKLMQDRRYEIESTALSQYELPLHRFPLNGHVEDNSDSSAGLHLKRISQIGDIKVCTMMSSTGQVVEFFVKSTLVAATGKDEQTNREADKREEEGEEIMIASLRSIDHSILPSQYHLANNMHAVAYESTDPLRLNKRGRPHDADQQEGNPEQGKHLENCLLLTIAGEEIAIIQGQWMNFHIATSGAEFHAELTTLALTSSGTQIQVAEVPPTVSIV
jgi:hypothetical protein